jgi:phosphoribosylpyrophosphate synthetase
MITILKGEVVTMEAFAIEQNQYLDQRVRAYYHTDYVGYQKPGNPDYINTLKNTKDDEFPTKLNAAAQQLQNVILRDFQQIQRTSNEQLAICVIPRAKAENSYTPNQMRFRTTVQNVAKHIGFIDGTSYIVRHTDTKTTHIKRPLAGFVNDGSMPYRGITEATCTLSPSIRNRNIFLVDDIYTKNVNIDEDAIQALLDNGARSVIFYAVARTVERT